MAQAQASSEAEERLGELPRVRTGAVVQAGWGGAGRGMEGREVGRAPGQNSHGRGPQE